MAQQDTHIGGAENDFERKPDSPPLPNKHPPTSSKRSDTKGEVCFTNLAMNLNPAFSLNCVIRTTTKYPSSIQKSR